MQVAFNGHHDSVSSNSANKINGLHRFNTLELLTEKECSTEIHNRLQTEAAHLMAGVSLVWRVPILYQRQAFRYCKAYTHNE